MSPYGTHGECGNVRPLFVTFAEAKGKSRGFQAIRSSIVAFLCRSKLVTHKSKSEIYPSMACPINLRWAGRSLGQSECPHLLVRSVTFR